MNRYHSIPSSDFSTLGSRVARWAGAPFRPLRWVFSVLHALFLGGMLFSLPFVTLVPGACFKLLLCSLFLWLGWNHGWTVAAGVHEISWVTSFWCSLPSFPLLLGSRPAKASS